MSSLREWHVALMLKQTFMKPLRIKLVAKTNQCGGILHVILLNPSLAIS